MEIRGWPVLLGSIIFLPTSFRIGMAIDGGRFIWVVVLIWFAGVAMALSYGKKCETKVDSNEYRR